MKNVQIQAYVQVVRKNITKAQVARNLDVSPRTIGRWVEQGRDAVKAQIAADLEVKFAGIKRGTKKVMFVGTKPSTVTRRQNKKAA